MGQFNTAGLAEGLPEALREADRFRTVELGAIALSNTAVETRTMSVSDEYEQNTRAFFSGPIGDQKSDFVD
ncbi:MAG TPA: hypothetical protein VF575_00470 [Candidatus Saccharimonadales bacterium]|jgi:hypothetical protein